MKLSEYSLFDLFKIRDECLRKREFYNGVNKTKFTMNEMNKHWSRYILLQHEIDRRIDSIEDFKTE